MTKKNKYMIAEDANGNPVFSLGFILGMLHKRIWNLIQSGIDKIHEG